MIADPSSNWSAFRLYGISSAITVGISNALVISAVGGEHDNFAAQFFARIDDVNEPYTIQMGRGSVDLTLDDIPSTIDSMDPPIMVATVKYWGNTQT